MEKIGKYEIISMLGQGTMGAVYEAFDPDINRKVAIKIIRPEIMIQDPKNEQMKKQFMREAQAAGKLSHPNIITIYEVGREKDMTYIVMQHVKGKNLMEILDEGKKLTLEEIVTNMNYLCDALDYAHNKGITHRDIKPANILIDEEEKPLIADFGIAKIETSTMTQTEFRAYTPSYMSPEQAKGKSLDRRTDIFSLGVVLYELLTGKRPFHGKNAQLTIEKIKNEEPIPVKKIKDDIPKAFNIIIKKVLAKNPKDRYQTCAELAADLNKKVQLSKKTTILKDREKDIKDLKKKKKGLIFNLKPKWVITSISIAVLLFASYLLLKESILPQPKYANHIAIASFHYESNEIENNLIEYLLTRSLTASSKLPVFTEEDVTVIKEKTESRKEEYRKPLIFISGEVYPLMQGLSGFEISIFIISKGQKYEHKFECKGYHDFFSNKIDEIHSFISKKSNGIIGKIEGDKKILQICTYNKDGLISFLNGEKDWNKLNSDSASSNYKTSIEHDPEFSLAHLRLAEVLLFRGDRKNAKKELKTAFNKKEKLIKYDLLKLKALEARINSKPGKEREYLMQLTEAFPLKKEYHYEFAESYFHCGNPNEAIKNYKKALDLDSNYSLAHNHIAFCYSWIGNHKQAEENFRKYVDLDDTANSYDSLASGYMFAGEYDKAIEALNEGKKHNSSLDYLYGNLSTNYILKGFLSKAIENMRKEAEITKRETVKIDTHFNLAYIEYLKGNINKANEELNIVKDFYSDTKYIDRLDESPNLAFWLTGVIAAQQGNLSKLVEVTKSMEDKITKHGVNATNYFPIYKFYLHLKSLEGYLENNINKILKNIEEAKRIKEKMGYWSSMFNLAFFLDQYAGILIEIDSAEEAFELLKESIEYNPKYASSRIKMAKIYLIQNNMEEAVNEYKKAEELLENADRELIFLRELEEIEHEIHR